MTRIESDRVGTLEVRDDRVIHFPEGIVGFPALKHFVVADDPDEGMAPFKWLVPVENPDMIFMVTDPGMFFSDYIFDLTEEDQLFLGAHSQDDVSVMTILTVPDEAMGITTNLRAPLVVNWKTMVGRQVILSNSSYQTKHYIFLQNQGEEAEATSAFGAVTSQLAGQTGKTGSNTTAQAGGSNT